LLAADRNNGSEVRPAAKEATAEDGTRTKAFLICLLETVLLHIYAYRRTLKPKEALPRELFGWIPETIEMP
jgi:hypothetical protein